MSRAISRFTKKRFLNGIPLPLLHRFFTPFASVTGIDLSTATADDIAEYLLDHGDRLPDDLVFKLHQLSDLATEEGMNVLLELGIEFGMSIEPTEPGRTKSDLTPQETAMLAYLDYQVLFDAGSERLLFRKPKGYAEYNGATIIDYESNPVKESAFENALQAFFEERYKGRWCRIRNYQDGAIHFLIQHGNQKNSYQIVEEDGLHSRLLREAKTDVLIFHPEQAKVFISGGTASEKKKIRDLFAKHLLEIPNWFDHPDVENNYTLEPLRVHGVDFKFAYEWDEECTGVSIHEIRFCDGNPGDVAVTIRFSHLLDYLKEHREFDPRTREIESVKFKFDFLVNGKKRPKWVTIKKPSSAQFDRRTFSKKIIEHLQRNRFAISRTA